VAKTVLEPSSTAQAARRSPTASAAAPAKRGAQLVEVVANALVPGLTFHLLDPRLAPTVLRSGGEGSGPCWPFRPARATAVATGVLRGRGGGARLDPALVQRGTDEGRRSWGVGPPGRARALCVHWPSAADRATAGEEAISARMRSSFSRFDDDLRPFYRALSLDPCFGRGGGRRPAAAAPSDGRPEPVDGAGVGHMRAADRKPERAAAIPRAPASSGVGGPGAANGTGLARRAARTDWPASRPGMVKRARRSAPVRALALRRLSPEVCRRPRHLRAYGPTRGSGWRRLAEDPRPSAGVGPWSPSAARFQGPLRPDHGRRSLAYHQVRGRLCRTGNPAPAPPKESEVPASSSRAITRPWGRARPARTCSVARRLLFPFAQQPLPRQELVVSAVGGRSEAA